MRRQLAAVGAPAGRLFAQAPWARGVARRGGGAVRRCRHPRRLREREAGSPGGRGRREGPVSAQTPWAEAESPARGRASRRRWG